MPPVRRVYLLAKLGELEPAILETTFWELAMRGRKELAEGRLEDAGALLQALHELVYAQPLARHPAVVGYRLEAVRLLAHYYLAAHKFRSSHQAFSFLQQALFQLPEPQAKTLPECFEERVKLGQGAALEGLGMHASAFEVVREAVGRLEDREGEAARELLCVGYLAMSRLSTAMGHATSAQVQLKVGMGLARSARLERLLAKSQF
jgi:hypothetical protein